MTARTPITYSTVQAGDIVVRALNHRESINGFFPLRVTFVDPTCITVRSNDSNGNDVEWLLNGDLFVATETEIAAYNARQTSDSNWLRQATERGNDILKLAAI